ncbi:splicing factor [Klebsormidium nitens]|uniref:Splicing factor n=1 Tax=Klebsormidium nitens TaxID=105231 RepID=A0A1Y1IUU2_KLENI|nr:splicing factor [Klebsormidium nitens]|eukprot:GAQ92008.1 splicing factor [Klebsormidium nitens]
MARPIYCGNFEYDARPSEIEKLFSEFGRVERVDMKMGFAFVYMESERDAEDAIHKLDGTEFGYKRRRLSVEWSKGDGSVKAREDARRDVVKTRPSKTLFVVNFDPIETTTRDIEKHFEEFGRLTRCQIRKNFAFVCYETVEDATRALEALDGRELMGRILTVQYSSGEDRYGGGGGGGSGGGGHGGDSYERRRSPPRHRSRSPPRRYRSRSPDYRPYGRGRSRSPDYRRR